MRTLFSILLVLLAVIPYSLHAQNAIVQNKNAVKLRPIWEVRGPKEQSYYGNGVGGGFDINNDGLGDFAVRFGAEWRVFYGDSVKLNDSVRWRFRTRGSETSRFFAGDFFGTGHKAIGVVYDSTLEGFGPQADRFYIFRSDDGYLPDTPAVVIDIKKILCFRGHQVIDLDGDGADELIIYHTCGSRSPKYVGHEVWIYRGGPNFRGDTPSVVIHDLEPSDVHFEAAGGDFDGDGIADILTAGEYINETSVTTKKLKIYFGSKDDPFTWNQPSRTIDITDDLPNIILVLMKVFDCDGDSLPDIWIEGRDGNTHLFRSGAPGKNARTRSYHLEDADMVLASPTFGIYTNAGYLNDSSRRYQMTALRGNVGSTNRLLLFSGGPDGPDSAYDAWYQDDLGPIFGWTDRIDDCDGDGWPEIIFGASDWYNTPFYYGKATILAGGPMIPRDSATSSVQDVAAGEKSRAFSFWPNPVREQLNIAWRGDLKQMPARIAVHDMLGNLITQGEIEPWRGTASWYCNDVPAGAYSLSVFDFTGSLISSIRVIKQ